MGKFVDLSGKKFGRLIVIEHNGINKRGGYLWKCLCSCGKTHIVRSDQLQNGDTKSCGCLYTPNSLEQIERLKKRLLKNHEKIGSCWIYTGFKQRYGMIKFQKKQIGVHRASYLAFIGEIPKGMLVCHSCDNPPCINPEHLWLGTHQDNNDDCIKKNRSKKLFGEDLKQTKLKEGDVVFIREKLKEKTATRRELAIKYKVTYECIKNIHNRRNWKHVE